MTKIIGVNEANAIRPKPSVIGLRSRSDEAIPTPSAVTSGTVTVEVVTPPESYAMPTISGGATTVIAMTVAYPHMIIRGNDQPSSMRSTPTSSAVPTDNATVMRRPRTYRDMSAAVSPIAPAPAAIWAASLATAVNAGSATVVPKPSRNENVNNQNTLPLRASAWASDSPMGNSASSRP